MVIFVYGEDTFRSRAYVREQVKKFKQTRDPQGLNVVFLDGKKEKLSTILGEIVSAPFLAERRMVVIENMLSTSDKEAVEELIDRVKKNAIPETNAVLFWQGEPLGKTKEIKELYTLLSKEKYVQNFEKLSISQLKAWVEKEVQERGGVFEKGVAEYVVEQTGGDMWLLNTLVDQLISFKKDVPISLKDVALFVVNKVDDDMFKLVEAVLAQNTGKAFGFLMDQRQKGFEEQELFGLLIWNIRILLELRDVFDREDQLPSDVMAKELGIHPFVVKKNFALMKRYSLVFLKGLYQELLEIDNKTKTGFANQSVLMDMFVARI